MKKKISFTSILNGISPYEYFSGGGNYLNSLGIDPDFSVVKKTSGVIFPVGYSKFSGANVTASPKWITTTQKDSYVYTYSSDGKFVRYDSALANETLLTTPTSGAGNGMAYYNNYLYLATPTDIARYGPLDGTPAIAQGVWTSAVLGSQTALGNPTMPSIRGNYIPNHAMHAHSDGYLYVCDFNNGVGMVHRVGTKKVAVEGDTNDNSGYNALDLGFGWYPVDIETYGVSLAILAIQTRDSTVSQGGCKIFLWDGFDDTFYNAIPLADPIGTALINNNGSLFAVTGNMQSGFRLSQYIGGKSAQEVYFSEDGSPCFAGGIATVGSRFSMASFSTTPENSACVYSFSSKSDRLPKALHNTVITSSSGANPIATSLAYVLQNTSINPQLVVGWKDDSGVGIDKYSATATLKSVWRSSMYLSDTEFSVEQIRIPFTTALGANMRLTPKLYFDDFSKTVTLQEINSTNFTGRIAEYFPSTLRSLGASGVNNFVLELNWDGSVPLPVSYPVTVEISTNDR